MRWSNALIPTLKESPADAVARPRDESDLPAEWLCGVDLRLPLLAAAGSRRGRYSVAGFVAGRQQLFDGHDNVVDGSNRR